MGGANFCPYVSNSFYYRAYKTLSLCITHNKIKNVSEQTFNLVGCRLGSWWIERFDGLIWMVGCEAGGLVGG